MPENEELPYPPTHPKGQHGLEQNRRLLPKEEAIQQVAEATGLPASKIREYAEQMRAGGNKLLTEGAVVATVPGLGRAMQVAAEAERLGIRVENRRLMYEGTDLTPYVQKVEIGNYLPHNPANRRTFYLLGKPYHFIQTEDGLETQPGESPWT